MQTGPVEIPGGTASSPHHFPAPRPTITPRTAPYSSSLSSVKTSRKEAVHLPYTSAQPDFADAPSIHGSQGKKFRADGSFVPKYQGISRLRGLSMASFYGGSDLHLLPSIRTTRSLHNQQMLPQISVIPATKHARSPQRRWGAPELHQRGTPVPVSIKRVEVSLHQVQSKNKEMGGIAPFSSPREEFENLAAAPKIEIKKSIKIGPKEITNVPLKSVDLNKGLHVAAAIKRRGGAKNRVSSLEKAFASREEPQVMTLSYLPLKEVYLKPDTASSKKQALKQQQDKTMRILQWLKELRYLDEKTVQRGRLEVEKTQFQLPEIKEPALAGYR